MPRILCLWFPRWPIQRRQVDAPEFRTRPLVLMTQPPRRGDVVAECCAVAERCGVRRGMPLVEAMALCQSGTNTIASDCPRHCLDGNCHVFTGRRSGRTRETGGRLPAVQSSRGLGRGPLPQCVLDGRHRFGSEAGWRAAINAATGCILRETAATRCRSRLRPRWGLPGHTAIIWTACR